LHDELVLARTPLNPLAPRETIAATIATLQSNHFVHRVSVIFDCVVLLLIAALAWPATRAARVDLILAAIAFTAAYCLIAFALMSRFEIWIQGVVPLSAAAFLLLTGLFWPRAKHDAEVGDLAAPPPAP
jgi:heme A synthase